MKSFQPVQYPIRRRFYRTKIAQLLKSNVYDSMRSNIGMLLVFYLVQLLRPKNILEIGFYEGQTFGAMIEACYPGTRLTALDIKLNRSLYDQHYHDTSMVHDKSINLIEISSSDFVANGKYDFINIDGGDDRYSDLLRAIDWIDPTGVIMLDNHESYDDQVVKFLESSAQHHFVPFLMDDQAVYFHRDTADHGDLLDVALEKIFVNHCDTSNVDYHGFTVKQIIDAPKLILNVNSVIYATYCQEFKL